jgi:hypothetical protein
MNSSRLIALVDEVVGQSFEGLGGISNLMFFTVMPHEYCLLGLGDADAGPALQRELVRTEGRV